MPCTLSTQKRAHLDHQAAAPVAAAMAETSYWPLPDDLTVKVAEHMVDDNDIDNYMAFRAVCPNWRTLTTTHPGKVVDDDHAEDPIRFQPTKWALLDKQDDVVTFVDVDGGRFLRMMLPILRSYLFIGATSGGLILLGEKEEPHRSCLLNPFTGAMAYFKVRAPAEGVAAVAVTKDPLMVFVSLEDSDVIWADQSTEHFKRFSRVVSKQLTPIASLGGDVYASDPHGAIFKSVVDVFPDGEKCRYAATIRMGNTIPSPNDNNASLEWWSECRYYMVQSGGDLLLVTKPLDGCFPDEQPPLVRRVDSRRSVLEPVSSIGSRAIFVSHVRCISIDADKFLGIQGGCIYFVEPIKTRRGRPYQPSTITTYQVADGPQAGLVMYEDRSRPFTITQVFADYCRSVHYHELDQMICSFWDWDYSDDSDSDETSSDGFDIEPSLSELEDAAEFYGFNYEA